MRTWGSVEPVSPRKRLDFDPIAEARRQWRVHGWDDAADGMAVTTSIVRVDQILRARIDGALRSFDLTFSRFELLVLLDFSRRGELPMGKLGDRLQVHPASITNAVDRLEAAGLVERRPHPEDGRATLASITADGRRLVHRATAAVNAEVFTDLGLDDGEQAALFDLLRRVRVAAGDFRPDDGPVVALAVEDPAAAASQDAIEAYYAELDRRMERGFDPGTTIPAEPEDLVPPGGAFVVARIDGEVAGCGAVKLHGTGPAEIKRMWVSPSARGHGIGRRLLVELERVAAAHGATVLHLETNRSLHEAIALYRSAGYVEVAPFNDEPHADHWFEKRVG